MLARSTDPIQSHDAADRARQFASGHRALILEALRKHGPLTAHGVAAVTNLTPEKVDRRRHELVSAGLVRLLDEQRRTPSGGWAQVMEAVS